MANIVSAFALSHAAFMLRAWDTAPQTTRDKVDEGYKEISRRLLASQPNVILLVGNDHYQSFFIDNMPAFCLGLGDRSTGWGEAGIPSYQLKIASEPAKILLESLLEKDFDISYSHNMPLDHAFMTPVHLLMPDTDIPIIPLFQNCVAPPLPTIKRCLQLGRALRDIIDSLDDGIRIALIATGGLSHEVPLIDWRTLGDGETDSDWLRYVSRGRYQTFPELQSKIQQAMADWGQKGLGRIDKYFDQEILLLLENGNYADLANYSYTQISQRAGNGGQEIRNWATVAGALPGTTAETLFYQAVPEWLTGVAGVAFKLGN